MHKSYYTVKPCQSKILQAKWDQKNYDAHRKKLQEIYPVIDTRAPRTYMHMHLKLKKIRLEEEKLYMIERDNRILLEKMSNIMRTRGRVDNQNNYHTKSLNRSRKQHELLRVARENQEIMQRIIEQQPQYSINKWNRDWNQNLDYIDQISMFPENWWIKTYNPKKSQSVPPSQSRRREDDTERSVHSQESEKNKAEEEKKSEQPPEKSKKKSVKQQSESDDKENDSEKPNDKSEENEETEKEGKPEAE